MSDTPPRLNLIQRAMQKAAVPAARPAPVNGSAEGIVAGESSAAPRAKIEASGRSADVRLDIAKLRDARILTPEDRESFTYNEFRSMKRRLLRLAQNSDTKSISNNLFLVTSALPGEGKTFTTMNLAISLASDRDLHVVVVDGDFARATLGECFEGPREKGLLDLLTGEAHAIDEVLHDCAGMPNLHVMFAGKRRELSMELFAGQRMAEICAQLSKRYFPSIVIIDTPPVLVSSEIIALASDVNHVLMVVSAGQANTHQVEEALQVVAKCPSINLVFNKAPEWQRPASHHYYYNYQSSP